MVKQETLTFYQQNKDIIDFIERHGSTEIKKIALALRLAVQQAIEKEGGGNNERG